MSEVLAGTEVEEQHVTLADEGAPMQDEPQDGVAVEEEAQAISHLINKIGAVIDGEKIVESVLAMSLMIIGAINSSGLDIDTRKRLAMTWCTAAAEVSTNIGLEFKDIAAAFANGVSHAKQ